MRRLSFILAIAWLWAAPAAAHAADRTLRIAAAANLRGTLDEVIRSFEAAHPGASVAATYGASGTFFAQIQNGAPFDLFLSADEEFPRRLAAAGLGAAEPFIYATGQLALWVPAEVPVDVAARGLRALLDPAVKRVAIGNPAVAPYGAAAEAALRSAGILESVKGKLVLGQSAQQAAQFAHSGNAQAALLPLSLAMAPPLAGAGRHLLLAADLHLPIRQAGLVLAGARDAPLAREFARHLLGPAGRGTLRRGGYALPTPR